MNVNERALEMSHSQGNVTRAPRRSSLVSTSEVLTDALQPQLRDARRAAVCQELQAEGHAVPAVGRAVSAQQQKPLRQHSAVTPDVTGTQGTEGETGWA